MGEVFTHGLAESEAEAHVCASHSSVFAALMCIVGLVQSGLNACHFVKLHRFSAERAFPGSC